jgi:hypothetical protein
MRAIRAVVNTGLAASATTLLKVMVTWMIVGEQPCRSGWLSTDRLLSCTCAPHGTTAMVAEAACVQFR